MIKTFYTYKVLGSLFYGKFYQIDSSHIILLFMNKQRTTSYIIWDIWSNNISKYFVSLIKWVN